MINSVVSLDSNGQAANGSSLRDEFRSPTNQLCFGVLQLLLAGIVLCFAPQIAGAQGLDAELQSQPARELAQQARMKGDAGRGAILFFQPYLACSKCHTPGQGGEANLGPDLAALGKEVTDELLVESVLKPSQVIRKGFESVTIVTNEGKSLVGLLVEQTAEHFVIRDVAQNGAKLTIKTSDVDESKVNTVSIMPAGQVNVLTNRQQFDDLIRYLIEIRDGGPNRARELQPSAALLTFTLPEYEQHLDHAGLISGWNADALSRGEAIYKRVCVNCHGTHEKPGSLPTSLRFAEGKFKNGSDPLSLYRTITRGFGQMAPQTWMVPSQKYDVIHYLRETYLKNHNPTQYVAVDETYLTRLPRGDTRGPEPSTIVAWSAMDYGHNLTHTYEIPGAKHNIAYKGIAVRLDPGAGGVSRGRHWLIFDTDTLRIAGAWNGKGHSTDNFIDWQSIQFDGAHGVHPRIVGQTVFSNSTGPGWGEPVTARFDDTQRVEGRDGRRYGPLPREWGQFLGLYHHEQKVILSYRIGSTSVLESPDLLTRADGDKQPLILRRFEIGPRDHDMLLQVAEHPGERHELKQLDPSQRAIVAIATPQANLTGTAGQGPADAAKQGDNKSPFAFDGESYLEIAESTGFSFTDKDFTVVASVRTRDDGSILAYADPGPKWTPDGQALFIRGGKLVYDIGWVGAVTGKTTITDDKSHVVAMTWNRDDRKVRLYVDGKLDGEGVLAAKQSLPKGVIRIGYTSSNFPMPPGCFRGEITEVRFYQSAIASERSQLKQFPIDKTPLVGRWQISQGTSTEVPDQSSSKHHAKVRRLGDGSPSSANVLVAGFAPHSKGVEWKLNDGRLQLRIPAGDATLRLTVWQPAEAIAEDNAKLKDTLASYASQQIADAQMDLNTLTKGGPTRWSAKLETDVAVGNNDGPFASDVLTAPEANPWLALTRFTGLDFFADGRMAVCTWDGDVWIVDPVRGDNVARRTKSADSTERLRWQRIASGLFQPLGLKIVDGKIHLTCRDQLAVLHDLNGDQEIDFIECLNNDHQVTEHFHEFAMGLQTDEEGNFYYAKSGCHGKAAVVPQHGTLLRVSKDGKTTEILATGFRAANGVCLNPDGSFVVTDQEGFWNPKNRINWVTVQPGAKPKFYGNMLGYHDVTDKSDAAMEPPLCWITNAFDRSPAELLWVDSERWGPLNKSLLNLSYGYGKVFLVPHERSGGMMQGGMIELPITAYPTGVMRGRFSPFDGQLYLCGMFAWAGNATMPGGLYRLRSTGQPIHLPTRLHAETGKLQLTFPHSLDVQSLDKASVAIKTWGLKRSENYGSPHINEQPLDVKALSLSKDGKTVTIEVPTLRPTWCMELKFNWKSLEGTPVTGTIHNTIHHLGD